MKKLPVRRPPNNGWDSTSLVALGKRGKGEQQTTVLSTLRAAKTRNATRNARNTHKTHNTKVTHAKHAFSEITKRVF